MIRRKNSIRYHKKKQPRRSKINLPRGLPLPMVLLAVFAIVGTIMYLTTTTLPKTNAFTVGANQIQIVEPDVNPDAVAWGTTTKPVKLRNPGEEGNAAGVVRAMLIPYLTDATTGDRIGGSLGNLAEPTGNQMQLGDIIFHFSEDWSTNWFYKDGFFYYRKVLKPGEETTKLLAGVTLASGKESEYTDVRARVDVMADILQTEGGAPNSQWGVNVSDGTVSP